jgi:hypothetical protein
VFKAENNELVPLGSGPIGKDWISAARTSTDERQGEMIMHLGSQA